MTRWLQWCVAAWMCSVLIRQTGHNKQEQTFFWMKNGWIISDFLLTALCVSLCICKWINQVLKQRATKCVRHLLCFLRRKIFQEGFKKRQQNTLSHKHIHTQLNGVSSPKLSPMQGGSLFPGRPISSSSTPSSSSSSSSCSSSSSSPLHPPSSPPIPAPPLSP